jgi:hypothetical protein
LDDKNAKRKSLEYFFMIMLDVGMIVAGSVNAFGLAGWAGVGLMLIISGWFVGIRRQFTELTQKLEEIAK